jgi:uncharacterized SAM-binding protein YcdF (DUF218 family)
MVKRILVLVLLGVVATIAFRHAASFLLVSAPEHADVIVVLSGGDDDLRYWTAVRLMQEGYAPRILLDLFSKGRTYGLLDIDLAQQFLQRTTPGKSALCLAKKNSTYDEARYLRDCLKGSGVKSVLVVTSDYHTRRALSILRARLPEYHFSIYAADDSFYFGTRWWTNREWAKTTLAEWQRYLWWQLVDRWRSDRVLH